MNGSQRMQDRRGSACARRRRRSYLLSIFAVDGGTVCHRCGIWLPPNGPWHVDRWPVQGSEGGRYTRDNIRPACAQCNLQHWPGALKEAA